MESYRSRKVPTTTREGSTIHHTVQHGTAHDLLLHNCSNEQPGLTTFRKNRRNWIRLWEKEITFKYYYRHVLLHCSCWGLESLPKQIISKFGLLILHDWHFLVQSEWKDQAKATQCPLTLTFSSCHACHRLVDLNWGQLHVHVFFFCVYTCSCVR